MSEELQLIAQCKEGCLDAFGELIRRHESRLYATLYHILHNTEDARDALQDAFLYAYQSLDQFQGRSDFYTWLYRIGVNSAINYKRKRKMVSNVSTGLNGYALESPDLARTSEPSHALDSAEQANQVWKALGRLPTRDRALLVLKDMEGLCYQDLARVLKMPIGTVRSRLHRARLKLRRLLKGAGPVAKTKAMANTKPI